MEVQKPADDDDDDADADTIDNYLMVALKKRKASPTGQGSLHLGRMRRRGGCRGIGIEGQTDGGGGDDAEVLTRVGGGSSSGILVRRSKGWSLASE